MTFLAFYDDIHKRINDAKIPLPGCPPHVKYHGMAIDNVILKFKTGPEYNNYFQVKLHIATVDVHHLNINNDNDMQKYKLVRDALLTFVSGPRCIRINAKEYDRDFDEYNN